MRDSIKIKIGFGVFLLWGILTGRCLPQWEDIANSPFWFGESLMYWIMSIVGLIVIYQSHKIIKVRKDGKTRVNGQR